MTRRVVVHMGLAELVDWARVVAGAGGVSLVTDARSARALERSGAAACFERVVVAAPAHAEVLAALAQVVTPDARVATMHEGYVATVAEARARFGLPGEGPEALRPFWHKGAMKERLAGWVHLVPWLRVGSVAGRDEATAREVVARLGLPVFAKVPVGHSSKDAEALPSLESVASFLERASDEHLLERYIDGEMFHVDSLQVAGETAWLGAGRYFAPCYAALHGAALGSVSVAPQEEVFPALRALHEAAMARLGRPSGATHMEVFRDAAGRWWFCEIAARAAGLVTPEMYAAHRGVDLRASHYRAALDLPDPLVKTPVTAAHAAWWTPLKVDAGRVASLRVPPLRSRATTWWQPEAIAREEAVTSSSLADVLGKFLLCADDRATLDADVATLQRWRPYTLEALADGP